MMTTETAIARVGIYCRVSTEEQSQDGISLTVQRERCLATVRAHDDWVLTTDAEADDAVFEDVQSGRDDDRPAYLRLLALAYRRQLDIVLLYKIDRLSRNKVESIKQAEELRKLGVRVWSVSEGGELNGFTLDLLLLLADQESRNISARVTPAMRRYAEQGAWMVRPPIGYRLVEKRLVIDEPKALVVREMFARAASGQSLTVIMRWLNNWRDEQGQPFATQQGRTWTIHSVGVVLRNPAYAGWVVYGKTRKSKVDGYFARPEGERVIVRGLHEPLIDQATFDQVQAWLATRPVFRRPHGERRYLLAGLARCPVCERRLGGNRSGYEGGIGKHVYRCEAGHMYAGGKRLDRHVLDAVGRLLISLADVGQARAILEADAARQPDEVATLRARRARLERRQRMATELVLDETISREEYRRQRAEIESEMAAIDRELASLAPSRWMWAN
jgi:site-specific DNA recombinase